MRKFRIHNRHVDKRYRVEEKTGWFTWMGWPPSFSNPVDAVEYLANSGLKERFKLTVTMVQTVKSHE